jgi:hypothetical protein
MSVSAATVTPIVVEGPTCAVCPHPVAAHDAIAQRFCRATENTATERGCVCPAG